MDDVDAAASEGVSSSSSMDGRRADAAVARSAGVEKTSGRVPDVPTVTTLLVLSVVGGGIDIAVSSFVTSAT